MKLKNIFKTIQQGFYKRRKYNTKFNLNVFEKKILDGLKKNGYYVVENFINSDNCDLICTDIDYYITNNFDKVILDEEQSDHRIFGAEILNLRINNFFKNEFINKIINTHEKVDNINGLILAAKLIFKPNNIGSGGGWHRDRADDIQTKAILYLSDVKEENGPFQYIKKSHTTFSIIKNILKFDFNFNQNRFSDDEIDSLLKFNNNKVINFYGKKGTLLFVNTRGIHRGMPIKSGKRYSLTYYVWTFEIPPHIKDLMIYHP
jgi:ectoine hydroxylase-related dioxygenase (phytanoyl-CoA dioxygenase family)